MQCKQKPCAVLRSSVAKKPRRYTEYGTELRRGFSDCIRLASGIAFRRGDIVCWFV